MRMETKASTPFWWMIACALLTMSCQTSTPTVEQLTPQLVVTDETKEIESSVAKAETELAPASYGYCHDDIFSKYLQESYLNSFDPLQTEKFGKAKSSSKRDAELSAFQRLNSHLPVAFGGLPIQATPRVYSWVKYFTTNGRQEFLLWLVRSESFKDLMVPILREEKIPEEFLFVAMIESGFSNAAYSKSSATGTWQFMRATAKHYGLSVNYWVDERKDPIKSTRAAGRYLRDLHRQFGDWYLALAAYNAGPRKIQTAIKATKSRDYWKLAKSPFLKTETKNYIPKLLAALIIATHQEHYGFDVAEDFRNSTPTTKVDLTHSFSLIDLSDALNIPLRELKKWNPELIRATTPPTSHLKNNVYQLRVPAPFASKLTLSQANLPIKAPPEMDFHTIKKGETISDLAFMYKTSVSQILQDNPSLNPVRLKPGQLVAVNTTFQSAKIFSKR